MPKSGESVGKKMVTKIIHKEVDKIENKECQNWGKNTQNMYIEGVLILTMDCQLPFNDNGLSTTF